MNNQTSKTQYFIDNMKVTNPGNEEMGILTRDKAHLSPTGNKLVADQMLKVLGVVLAEPEYSQREDFRCGGVLSLRALTSRHWWG